MAKGDVINFGPTSVVDDGYLDLQPGSGIECSIHNINHGGAIELYFYDGTNSVISVVVGDATPLVNMALRCTNTAYYRVKNVSGGSIYISADGLVTK